MKICTSGMGTSTDKAMAQIWLIWLDIWINLSCHHVLLCHLLTCKSMQCFSVKKRRLGFQKADTIFLIGWELESRVRTGNMVVQSCNRWIIIAYQLLLQCCLIFKVFSIFKYIKIIFFYFLKFNIFHTMDLLPRISVDDWNLIDYGDHKFDNSWNEIPVQSIIYHTFQFSILVKEEMIWTVGCATASMIRVFFFYVYI
jgi:hypothetical protein